MRATGILALVALVGVAPASLAAEQKSAPRNFAAGKSKLVGKDTSVCFIEGSWADGSPFVFQAWDRCAALSIRPVFADEFNDAQHLGRARTSPEAASPLEAFQVNNAHSRVYIYKDRRGHLRERLVGD